MKVNFLKIGYKHFNSRLILGTGKYNSFELASRSILAGKVEMVTVSVRQLQSYSRLNKKNILQNLDWSKIWLLPNTAGSKTAEEAIRMAFLAREFNKSIGQENNNFIKLEVITDSKYLLPDPFGTIKAAEFLVRKGFTVLPYMNADPILAKHLEDIGCASLMPLASPIGSGQGLVNKHNINLIIENSNLPVIVDAGLRTPSQATEVMEMGAAAVLLNTAVAKSGNPVMMANAMAKGIESGYMSYLAGNMPQKKFANASSSSSGIFF